MKRLLRILVTLLALFIASDILPAQARAKPDRGAAREGMEEVLKDRYIVVFKKGRGNRRGDADRIRRRGGKLRHQFRRLRGAAVQLTPAQRQALARDPEVAYIEQDQLVFPMTCR